MIGNRTIAPDDDGGSAGVGRARVAYVLVLLAASFGPASASFAAAPSQVPTPTSAAQATIPVDQEAAQLREALRQEVPGLITDTPQSEQAWVALTQAMLAATGQQIDRPELLVVADRNPRIQQMRVLLARPDGPWQSLGGSKVSTGRPGKFEHFWTPVGVFRHTDAILDWRAEGTLNEHNVRGLGAEGMRIWDFGWQRAQKGWGDAGIGKMRLLLHATDPTRLERRLGRVASDGCIRLETAMNRFLDVHGVLDADYERAAQRKPRFAALLLPQRVPTPLAGDRLVVVDSSQAPTNAVGQTGEPQPHTTTAVQPASGKTVAQHGRAHRAVRPHHHHHGRVLAAR